MRIAYEFDGGKWSSLQPDFIVISRRSNDTLGASIIDPHGAHLADALAKLKALSDYAEEYGREYVRIESLSENSEGEFVILDHQNPKVREAIRNFSGGKATALYDSDLAQPYV